MGRSRGGLTTKIHAVSDVTGLPIRYDLSPGQAHDTTAAGAMLATLPPDSFLVADKAYDAKWIRDLIEQRDAVPIIPDREGKKTRHAFSKPLSRLRNRIERLARCPWVDYDAPADIKPHNPRPSLTRLLDELHRRTLFHVRDVVRTGSAGLALMTTGPYLAWLAVELVERLPGAFLWLLPLEFGRFR